MGMNSINKLSIPMNNYRPNIKLKINKLYIYFTQSLLKIKLKIQKEKKKKRNYILDTFKFSSLPPPLDNSIDGKSKLTLIKRFLNKIWIYLIITHRKFHGCGGRRNRWTWMLGSRFFERKSVAGAAVALLYTRCRPRV